MLENFFLLLDDTHIGDNVCSESNVLKALQVVGYIIFIAKFAVPLIIMVVGSVDIAKSIMDGTQEAVSKHVKAIALRLVLGVFIFFIPSIINVILAATPQFDDINGEYTSCKDCMLTPFECEIPD